MMLTKNNKVRAILVLIAAGLCCYVVGTGVNCMGIFTPYFILECNATRFQVAWIGSLTNGLSFGFMVVVAVIFEQTGIAPSVGAAAILFVGSLVALSLVTKLWLAFILFSIAGCCESVMLLGAICFTSQYFKRTRQTALAIIMFIGGCGGLVGSFAFKELLHSEGLRAGLFFFAALGIPIVGSAAIFHIFRPSNLSKKEHEATGGIFEALELSIKNSKVVSMVSSCPEYNEVFPHCIFGLGLMEEEMEERYVHEQAIEVSGIQEYIVLMKEPRLILFMAGLLLVNLSNSINLLLMSDMVADVFDVTTNEAAYTFVALAFGGVLGRLAAIGLSFVEYNRLSSVAGQMAIHAVLIMFYPSMTYEAVCVLAGVFGFTHGYTSSVQTQFTIDTFGLKGLPKYVSLGYMVKGLGSLLGGPLAGAIKDKFSYGEALYFGGGVLLIGCVLLFVTTYHPKTRLLRAETRESRGKERLNSGSQTSPEAKLQTNSEAS